MYAYLHERAGTFANFIKLNIWKRHQSCFEMVHTANVTPLVFPSLEEIAVGDT